MNFADRYFEQKVSAWAKNERADRAQQLAVGGAADYPDYRERIGYIRALDDMLATILATEREMAATPQRQERV